jgi:hypothetical protein
MVLLDPVPVIDIVDCGIMVELLEAAVNNKLEGLVGVGVMVEFNVTVTEFNTPAH